MLTVKITKEKQILDVKHYRSFRNVVADIGSLGIFENIGDELVETLGNPRIYAHSVNDQGIADDFEFRYANGILVYVGDIYFDDEFKANKAKEKTEK